MKKILLLALLSLSICQQSNKTKCNDVVVSNDVETCNNTITSNNERCCFVETKVKFYNNSKESEKKYKGCYTINQTEYDEIKTTIKNAKNEVKEKKENNKVNYEIKKLDIDCHCNYLRLTFFALLSLLF